MIESKVFYFTVKSTDSGSYAVCVKAPNLITAKDCLEKQQGILTIEHVQESDISPSIRERMNELECPQLPEIRAGYAQSDWPVKYNAVDSDIFGSDADLKDFENLLSESQKKKIHE